MGRSTLHTLADGGGVDIDMDDLCVGGKGLDLSGDPVIKTGSDGDQEIGFHHRHVGPVGSVHSQHPQREGMVARKASQVPSGSWSRESPAFRPRGSVPLKHWKR